MGHTIGLGNIGVQLFFVLSGFLIAGILLNSRDRFLAGELSLGGILGSFHLSRIARIWPIAFLTLGLVFVAGDRFERRDDLIWHALFASNVLFFQRGEFGSTLAHFWSLAVEQQFYVVWPLLVLIIPGHRLEPVILALIALAPIARLALHAAGFTRFAEYNVLPFANFDSLGLGALVALWSRLAPCEAESRWRALAWAALAAVAGLFVMHGYGGLPANPGQTLYAVAFAWLIGTMRCGLAGPAGDLLGWRPLAWLGVISYGVYVYHMFAPRIVGWALRVAKAPAELQSGLPFFAASAALTLAAAALSWRFVEQPILNQCRRRRQSVVPDAT